MTLALSSTDHGDLCHGWVWVIEDEALLAERVARIALGQYRHVAKILAGAGVPGPLANAEQARAAITQLTVVAGADPWDRDGWIFQAISWIAALQTSSAAMTRMPHIRKSDKGFDGLQLQLNDNGTAITAVVLFEDKATENDRKTIREEVWPGIEALERGDRLNELSPEVSGMLGARAEADPAFDLDAAIAEILWHEARHYRVSITVANRHDSKAKRAALFKGFDTSAPGDVRRRRADTIQLPELRDWMKGFSEQVIASIKVIAGV